MTVARTAESRFKLTSKTTFLAHASCCIIIIYEPNTRTKLRRTSITLLGGYLDYNFLLNRLSWHFRTKRKSHHGHQTRRHRPLLTLRYSCLSTGLPALNRLTLHLPCRYHSRYKQYRLRRHYRFPDRAATAPLPPQRLPTQNPHHHLRSLLRISAYP